MGGICSDVREKNMDYDIELGMKEYNGIQKLNKDNDSNSTNEDIEINHLDINTYKHKIIKNQLNTKFYKFLDNFKGEYGYSPSFFKKTISQLENDSNMIDSNAKLYWNNELACRSSMSPKEFIESLIQAQLSKYNVTSSLLTYIDIVEKYADDWNEIFSKKGESMKIKDVEYYLVLIQQDKLFFDKLCTKLYRYDFMTNFNDNEIIEKYNKFQDLLKKYKINFFDTSPDPNVIKDIVSNETNFRFISHEDSHYYGYVENNNRSGLGILFLYALNQLQFGNWEGNYLKGHCLFRSFDSEKKITEEVVSENDVIDGYARLTGFTPTGEMNWFKRGTFQNGQLNGYGQQLYPNGDFHEGMYDNDVNYGFGYYLYSNLDCYVGHLTNSAADFYGEYYYEFKDVYKGFFMDNLYHGWGYYEWNADGNDRYEGEWANGQRNGYGILKLESGSNIEGVFENDELVDKVSSQEDHTEFMYMDV